MTEVTIDIPKESIDSYSREKIEELEHKLELALKREEKWKKKCKDLEATESRYMLIAQLAEQFVDNYVDIVPEVTDRW